MNRVAGARATEARSVSQRQRGMTLIEVVVAVALLAMLSAGLFTALQIGTSSWQRTRDALMLDRRISTANTIFHSLLASIVPIEAEVPGGQAVPFRRFLFFQGEPRSMRFVTSHSLIAGARGGLHITELQVTPSGEGLRILLNQSPYRGPFSIGRLVVDRISAPGARQGRLVFRPIRALPTSLIIADELSQCVFSYLRLPLRRGEEAVWQPYWDEREALPGAIRINLIPLEREARVLPVTITTPVRAHWLPLRGAAPPRR